MAGDEHYLAQAALQTHSFVYQFLSFQECFANFFYNEMLQLSKAADVCGEERAVLNVCVKHCFVSSHAETVGIKRMRV
jgi:hypothetical protein